MVEIARSKANRVLLTFAIVCALFLGSQQHARAAGDLTLFTTEQKAQKHCPQDTVVWLNLPSGIYHFKGQRWYGNTQNGAFVCEKEAKGAGDRATLNGQ